MSGRPDRVLTWPALVNARDLGGLPSGEGTTRFGAVVRTDSLARLTAAGLAAMLGHGVTTVVDLRSPRELRAAPSPFRGRVGYRHLPFLDDAALLEVGRYDSFEDGYRWQVESQMARIGAVLAGLAGAPAGGIVVHCAAGKDRTGIVVALLLTLAGVDRDAIAADYALSAPALTGVLEGELAAEPDRERRARLRRVYDARPDVILSMLAHLDERFGGVAAYLDAAGVDGAARARLAALLR
ncbi:MAG TPA: tyrosine-protein phosphatase [Candidatus Dormibacteraeota bacterium]|nr:tyrosine-protein phosphatase [Candidatus Dormibacteraeota bacterium]